MPCKYWLEPCPYRGSGTDGDSLDHSEEIAGTD